MRVFVYGTLTDPDRAGTVLDEYEYRGSATLEGLHRVDGEYPTLAPGGRVEGRILRTPDATALDRYEGVASGLYVRVSVPLAEGDARGSDRGGDSEPSGGDDRTVETYVGDPDPLGAPAEWPGDGPFAERVARYCQAEPVVVRRTSDAE